LVRFIELCVSLAVTNALTSILLWFANNLLFLFHDAMMRLANRNSCAFMITLAAALFISLAFVYLISSHPILPHLNRTGQSPLLVNIT